MNNLILKNVFTDKEIIDIKKTINDTLKISKENIFEDQAQHNQQTYNKYIYLNQGRMDVFNISFTKEIINKITNIANEMFKKDLFFCGTQYTEYTGNLKGNPSLGMHYDGGDVDFILDYQLESNFSWGIAIEENVYHINDNELILLRPVSKFHYRPKKKFDSDQYLKMIFFKFMEKNFIKYKPITLSEEKLNIIQNIYENYYEEK